MKKLILGLALLGIGTISASAAETYTFNCKNSMVEGHIKYALIGSYDFSFKDCNGSLIYDPLKKEIRSVRVQISINSISSNCPFCNKVAVSKKLLNAAVYPFIIYQAHDFQNKGQSYWVKGRIKVHGMAKNLTSPFSLEKSDDQLIIKGQWLLRRRDFHIIWSKILDHGGVIVGEIVKVNWKVHAYKNHTRV